MRKFVNGPVLMGLGLVVIVAVIGSLQRSTEVRFPNGDLAQIRPPSFWASIRGSRCRIDYQPKGEEGGRVELWQDLHHGIIAVLGTSTRNAVLCLYEFDTDLRLLAIDPTRKFRSFPTTASSCLSAVVCASPWDIQEAQIGDWQEALDSLKKVASGSHNQPIVSTLPLGLGRKLSPITQRMTGQIKLMLDNGATQWPVTTTLRSSVGYRISKNPAIEGPSAPPHNNSSGGAW